MIKQMITLQIGYKYLTYMHVSVLIEIQLKTPIEMLVQLDKVEYLHFR